MKILLIGPTALDYRGQPIKQRRLHLPGLTLPMLAAVSPSHVQLRLVSETVEDIPFDRLPVPRYDLMNKSKLGFWRPVQATRGCPFTCNYCSITSFLKADTESGQLIQIVRDVRAAKHHGTKYIAFIDDNIGVDFNYSAELWEALIPEKILWMSQCSLHIAERPEMKCFPIYPSRRASQCLRQAIFRIGVGKYRHPESVTRHVIKSTEAKLREITGSVLGVTGVSVLELTNGERFAIK